MAEANVALIGMDALNVDNIEDLSRPVHHIVLGKDIPLIAHLINLNRLPYQGARLTALPPRSTAWAASRSAPWPCVPKARSIMIMVCLALQSGDHCPRCDCPYRAGPAPVGGVVADRPRRLLVEVELLGRQITVDHRI
jgi:hypothetical protein